jgi:hypothetical protein
MAVDDLKAAEILLGNARYEYEHAEKWFESLDQKAHNLTGYVAVMVGFVGGVTALLSGVAGPQAGGGWTGVFMLPCLVCLWWTWAVVFRTARLVPSALPPSTERLSEHVLHPDATEASTLLALARGTWRAARIEADACERKAEMVHEGHQWLRVALLAFAAGFLCALLPVIWTTTVAR